MRLLPDKKYLEISLYVIFTVISIYSLILIINSTLFVIINLKSVVISIFNIVKYFVKLFSTIIIAFIIAYVLDPIADFFQKNYDILKNKLESKFSRKRFDYKFKIKNEYNIKEIKKRKAGTILTYIFVFVIFFSFSFLLFNSLDINKDNFKDSIIYKFNKLSEELNNLTLKFIEILKDFNIPKNIYKYIENFTLYFDNIGNKIFLHCIKSISSFSIDIINFILSLIIAFYIMENKYYIKCIILKFIDLFFNNKINRIIKIFFRDVDYIFSKYIKCQFIDGAILSILISSALYIINIDFAIEIGIITGILNIIPYAGLIVGIVLAIISTLLEGQYIKMIYSVLIIFILQQIDSLFISPRILKDVAKLNPATIISILLISGKLFGILGIILSIPVFSLIKRIFVRCIKNYINNKNKKVIR